MFVCLFTVPPLLVNLVGDRKRPLSAGRETRMECKCKGSRPAPIFRWYVGQREIDTTSAGKMSVEHHIGKPITRIIMSLTIITLPPQIMTKSGPRRLSISYQRLRTTECISFAKQPTNISHQK